MGDDGRASCGSHSGRHQVLLITPQVPGAQMSLLPRGSLSQLGEWEGQAHRREAFYFCVCVCVHVHTCACVCLKESLLLV